MLAVRAFPPLRGGIKGGVTRVQSLHRGSMRQPLLPTLNPSPLGREAGRALHDERAFPSLRRGIKGELKPHGEARFNNKIKRLMRGST